MPAVIDSQPGRPQRCKAGVREGEHQEAYAHCTNSLIFLAGPMHPCFSVTDIARRPLRAAACSSVYDSIL